MTWPVLTRSQIVQVFWFMIVVILILYFLALPLFLYLFLYFSPSLHLFVFPSLCLSLSPTHSPSLSHVLPLSPLPPFFSLSLCSHEINSVFPSPLHVYMNINSTQSNRLCLEVNNARVYVCVYVHVHFCFFACELNMCVCVYVCVVVRGYSDGAGGLIMQRCVKCEGDSLIDRKSVV